MRYSNFAGIVRWSGGTTILSRGQSIDDDHPLLAERPDLFNGNEPGASLQTHPTPAPVERATRAPGEVRQTPGKGPANRVPKSGSGQ